MPAIDPTPPTPDEFSDSASVLSEDSKGKPESFLIRRAREHPFYATSLALAVLCAILIPVIVCVSPGERVYAVILFVASSVAFPLAIWRTLIGEQQRDAQKAQAKTARDQVEIARQEAASANEAALAQVNNANLARLNDQFSAAATMMGHDAVSVRRIGIQSLQNLAIDHPDVYYVRVLRTLCDYAREPFPGEKMTILGGSPHLRSDIQGAIQAIGKIWDDEDAKSIGRAGAKEPNYVPNLIGADLRYARFWSLNLSYAHFGGAICIGAVFGKVNFTEVNLAGANLTGADFTGESIDDRESKEKCFGLTQQQVDLACADPNERPIFAGVIDPETGKEITWQGDPCPSTDDEA